VAETRLGAKVLAKILGNENWHQIMKFKQLGENLAELLQAAKEHLHPEPYKRQEVCQLLGLKDEELSSECLTENTRQLTSFQLHDRAVHVFSEAARVYQFKSVCNEAAVEDPSEVFY
jgi:N-acetylgalactosamine kinase